MPFCICFLKYVFKYVFFISERGRGIEASVMLLCTPLTGDRAHILHMCPNQESYRDFLVHGSTDTQPLRHTGWTVFLLLCFDIYISSFVICTSALTAFFHCAYSLLSYWSANILYIVKTLAPEHLEESDVSQSLVLISLLGQGSEWSLGWGRWFIIIT